MHGGSCITPQEPGRRHKVSSYGAFRVLAAIMALERSSKDAEHCRTNKLKHEPILLTNSGKETRKDAL